MKRKTYCSMDVIYFSTSVSVQDLTLSIFWNRSEITGKYFEERIRRGNKEVDKNVEIFRMNNKTII